MFPIPRQRPIVAAVQSRIPIRDGTGEEGRVAGRLGGKRETLARARFRGRRSGKLRTHRNLDRHRPDRPWPRDLHRLPGAETRKRRLALRPRAGGDRPRSARVRPDRNVLRPSLLDRSRRSPIRRGGTVGPWRRLAGLADGGGKCRASRGRRQIRKFPAGHRRRRPSPDHGAGTAVHSPRGHLLGRPVEAGACRSSSGGWSRCC